MGPYSFFVLLFVPWLAVRQSHRLPIHQLISLPLPISRMSGSDWWCPVNYRLFGGNYVNLYILCSIVVICKTKQSQFSRCLIVSIIDHTCMIPQHSTIKSLLAPILCTLCPSPNQHTSRRAHGELLVTHTAKPISTNLWQFSWRVIIYPSPVLWSIITFKQAADI